VDCESPKYPELGVEDVIDELLAGLDIPIPVVRHLPFGHCEVHAPWPFGVRAVLDGDHGEVELLESAVTPGG
jgi:muramoyltetrapeptide carboxypeptidase LdcA involved in peptidoglycan recycling